MGPEEFLRETKWRFFYKESRPCSIELSLVFQWSLSQKPFNLSKFQYSLCICRFCGCCDHMMKSSIRALRQLWRSRPVPSEYSRSCCKQLLSLHQMLQDPVKWGGRKVQSSGWFWSLVESEGWELRSQRTPAHPASSAFSITTHSASSQELFGKNGLPLNLLVGLVLSTQPCY